MHAKVKAQIKEYYASYRLVSGELMLRFFTANMKDRMRSTVGESYRRRTDDYLNYFLKQKQDQMEKQQQRVQQQEPSRQPRMHNENRSHLDNRQSECHKLETRNTEERVEKESKLSSIDSEKCEGAKQPIRTFSERVAALKAYKEKHGHLNVKTKDDKSLAKFCINTRCSRNNPGRNSIKLTEDHIASLDALGFDWKPKERTILSEQRIEDLRAYKEKHGHLNIRQSEDKSLNGFCLRVKKSRNGSGTRTLTDDQVDALNELNFDWNNSQDALLSAQVAALKACKEKYWHLNVSRKDDSSLAQFCSNIRYARNNPGKGGMTMNEGRIACLDVIGFVWTPKVKSTEINQSA